MKGISIVIETVCIDDYTTKIIPMIVHSSAMYYESLKVIRELG